jgi:CMP-N-acetylneuraminic acid synthetase
VEYESELMKNAWIIIPARKNSKGFPNKNRYLFDYTAQKIPAYLCERTIFTTDDEELIKRAERYNFKILKRDSSLCQDDTSMKLVIKDAVEKFNISPTQDLITLYLTYPQRKFDDIKKIYDFYLKAGAQSLLCQKKILTHPYMCYLVVDGSKGAKVVDHQLYRRQEYPACFEACHYTVITSPNILNRLDNNLYYEDTFFYPLSDTIVDVDYESDLKEFKEKK